MVDGEETWGILAALSLAAWAGVTSVASLGRGGFRVWGLGFRECGGVLGALGVLASSGSKGPAVWASSPEP